MSKNYIIIPAHFDSKRLPGKALLEETGKPLIQHTWENACRIKYQYSDLNFEIFITTDNTEIEDRCNKFGAKVIMTGRHENGTRRVAEAIRYLPFDNNQFNSVTNLQVDYPDLPLELIPSLIMCMVQQNQQLPPELQYYINTVCYQSATQHDFLDKDNVKAVMDGNSNALYFSRAPIPYDAKQYFIHAGVYTWQYQALQKYETWCNQQKNPQIQESEGLEQNKWLFLGQRIHCIGYNGRIKAINTVKDYEQFVREYRELEALK